MTGSLADPNGFAPHPHPGVILASATSTNQLLAQQWRNFDPFTFLAAREQSAGHGRLGRPWLAPASSALLVSILAPVPAGPADPALTALATALATADLVAEELPSASITLKWPNDVLLAGQKVAGILTEYLTESEGQHQVVVGVGLNLTVPEAILSQFGATSLAAHGWSHATGTAVPDSVLADLAERLAQLLARRVSRLDQVPAEFSERCPMLGQPATALLPGGGEVSGLARAITATGELVIGQTPVRAGEVTLAKKKEQI